MHAERLSFANGGRPTGDCTDTSTDFTDLLRAPIGRPLGATGGSPRTTEHDPGSPPSLAHAALTPSAKATTRILSNKLSCGTAARMPHVPSRAAVHSN